MILFFFLFKLSHSYDSYDYGNGYGSPSCNAIDVEEVCQSQASSDDACDWCFSTELDQNNMYSYPNGVCSAAADIHSGFVCSRSNNAQNQSLYAAFHTCATLSSGEKKSDCQMAIRHIGQNVQDKCTAKYHPTNAVGLTGPAVFGICMATVAALAAPALASWNR